MRALKRGSCLARVSFRGTARQSARTRLGGGLTHRWCFMALPSVDSLLRGSAWWLGTARFSRGLRRSCNVLAHRRRVDLSGHTQCPAESPAPLGELDTPLVGMQPCAPAGGAPTRIGNDHAVRIRYDAEQLGGRGPLSASDARPNRALWIHRGPVLCGFGCRRRCNGHLQSTPRSSARPIPPPVHPRPRRHCVCRSGTR